MSPITNSEELFHFIRPYQKIGEASKYNKEPPNAEECISEIEKLIKLNKTISITIIYDLSVNCFVDGIGFDIDRAIKIIEDAGFVVSY